MTPACTGTDDGLHRWRFGIGRWAGTPSYQCDSCSTIALPTGDGLAEDYAYLGTSGVVVRDDGLHPYAVTYLTGAVGVVHVLARDADHAAEVAVAEAEYAISYVEDLGAAYGVGFAGSVEVTDAEPLDVATAVTS